MCVKYIFSALYLDEQYLFIRQLLPPKTPSSYDSKTWFLLYLQGIFHFKLSFISKIRQRELPFTCPKEGNPLLFCFSFLNVFLFINWNHENEIFCPSISFWFNYHFRFLKLFSFSILFPCYSVSLSSRFWCILSATTKHRCNSTTPSIFLLLFIFTIYSAISKPLSLSLYFSVSIFTFNSSLYL